MFTKISKIFTRFYHRILEFFFDFDIGVYEVKPSKIPVKTLENFEYDKPVKIRQKEIPEFSVNSIKLKAPSLINYTVPSLLSALVLKNANEEFYNSLKLKAEMLKFICISKNYDIDLEKNLHINEELFVLEAKSHKSLDKEIQISRKLKTIEELLELEPYVKEFPKEEVRKFKVTKYPIKQDKFTEKQIESMKTILAIQAKCKKYGMTISGIYDRIPEGLYSELELNKDNTLTCTFENNPKIGDNQLLVTGKRRYDTQLTKKLVKYSEIGLKINPNR